MNIGIAMGVAGIPLPKYREIAIAAENAGAYALCVGESANESFSAAAYFGSFTNKTKIISSITTWVRPPINTALAASTVDEITNGRFELGLGTMPDHVNREHYGINPDHPLFRMREYVAVIRAGWNAFDGRTADFKGEFYEISGYRRLTPPLRSALPIHLAVTRPRMAKLAGEIADGVIVNVLHTYTWLHSNLEPSIREGSQKSQNKLTRGIVVRVLIESDPKKAREILKPSFNPYRNVPYFHEVTAAAGFITTPTSDIPDDLVDEMTVHGSMEEVIEQLNYRYGDWADWIEVAPPSGVAPEVINSSYQGLIKLISALKK